MQNVSAPFQRIALGLLLTVLAGAWPALHAAPASATIAYYTEDTITQNGDLALIISAHPNEVNEITARFDRTGISSTYTIVDGGAIDLVYNSGCSTTTQPGTLVCDGNRVTALEVTLGDRDDTLTLDPTVGTFTLLAGGPGDDNIKGGSGPDQIGGEAGFDRVSGGAGDDTLRSDGRTFDPTASADEGNLSGGPGNDVLHGTDGRDVMDGGDGNDEMRAYAGDDTIDGGDGIDTLNGGDGGDTMEGGPGNDFVGTAITQAPGNVSLERGDDMIDGGSGDDMLRPGAGPPDFCTAMVPADCSDNDTLVGGDGYDTVIFERRTLPLRVSIDGVADDGQRGESDNLQPGIEKLVGGAGDDTLIGSPLEDNIDGAGGDDLIDGVGGSDLLEGGTVDGGSDHLAGGSGNDTLSGSAGDDFVEGQDGADSALGGAGADLLDGGPGNDRLSGGPGADRLRGRAANDDLDGGDDPDVLEGDEGDDALRGAGGDDNLVGGAGADDMSGGDGAADQAVYDIAARVTVTLDNLPNDGVQRGRERDNVRVDVERVLGGGDQDTFFGSARGNKLDGASGQDYVDGGAGLDELLGGGGRDVIRARDRNRDVVDCGRSVDFAIVDSADEVRGNCERTSEPSRDRPRQGADIIVDPVQGTNQLQPAGLDRTVPLQDRVEIAVRSSVDATDGRVTVITEGDGAERQSGLVYGGRFGVDQKRGESIAEIELQGGETCSAGGSRGAPVGQSLSRRRKKRSATTSNNGGGSGKFSQAARRRGRASEARPGRFRTVGTFSSATSGRVATLWVTEDRCNGTLTRVVRGSVVVRDFSRRRSVTLNAGESYLAPAR